MSIQTSDAALKNQQQSITINSSGVPQSYLGVVNIGTGFTVGPGAGGVLNSASKVLGTIAALNGDSLVDNGQFMSAASLSVIGQNGVAGGGGYSSSLTTGSMLTSNGTVTGGSGASISSSYGVNGGNASLTVNGNASWPNFALVAGNDDSSAGYYTSGGGASLTLNTTLTSTSLTIYINSGSDFSGISIIANGPNLSTITPTFTGGFGSHAILSIDFSSCILNDFSINDIVNGLLGFIVYSGSGILNVAGSCAPVSGGTLTSISALQANGWTVNYNT